MGKVVPFKRKPSSLEEEALMQRLQTKSDDLEALTEIFLLKVRKGQFDPESDYATGVLKCIKKVEFDEINLFLKRTSSVIESMSWPKHTKPSPAFEKHVQEFKEKFPNFVSEFFDNDEIDRIAKARKEIYGYFFKEDSFLDVIYQFASNCTVPNNLPSTKTAGRSTQDHVVDKLLKPFFLECLEKIISKHGLTDEIVCVLVFCENILDQGTIKSSIKKHLSGKDLLTLMQSKAEKYLSRKFRQGELDFFELYKLLMLQVDLNKNVSDICNAIIATVPKIEIFHVVNLFSFSEKAFSFSEALKDKSIQIKYVRTSSEEEADFMTDLLLKLYEERKYDQWIARVGVLFFGQDEMDICPVGYLVLDAIYWMDENDYAEVATEGFFLASLKFFRGSLYPEAVSCLKSSLFNALFMGEKEDPLNIIDMTYFMEVTRKLTSYKDSINFLSKFRLFREQGLPINQAFLNEVEITITQLEYELESRQYHKIDAFYELVAKEDFPAIQSHVTVKDKSKFVLTGNQLEILLKKIKEKSDIIQGIKSISAKCDMLMYMHREVYDKQAAILETIKENQEVFEDVISRNTEKIIDNIHKKNESFEKQVNLKTCQEFYHGHIGTKLWTKLDEGTKNYLLLGRHLDATHQYSPSDECGFIAIEYALAIENEFKTKLIDGFLSTEAHIKFKTGDGIKLIEPNSRITLGEICLLLDKARKVKDSGDLLWSFVSFIEKHTVGGNKIFDCKNALFDIKNKYRNPAAHPSNYKRELLDAFKNLLFQKGFIKDYFESIQIKVPK